MNSYFVAFEMPVKENGIYSHMDVSLHVKADTLTKACETIEKEFDGSRITESYEIKEDG
jgi:hypothetical protein